jgi:hypothetical protein
LLSRGRRYRYLENSSHKTPKKIVQHAALVTRIKTTAWRALQKLLDLASPTWRGDRSSRELSAIDDFFMAQPADHQLAGTQDMCHILRMSYFKELQIPFCGSA